MPDESPHFTTDPVDLDAIDARIALFVYGDAWVTWRTSTIAAMSAELRELRAENERLRRWDGLGWAVVNAATRLRGLHRRRDQMIANDTWESDGAYPTYRAIDNAEQSLEIALDVYREASDGKEPTDA